jgi:translation initiation factor 4A
VLQSLDIADRRPQALILVPTRELALAIENVVTSLGAYLKCTVCNSWIHELSKLEQGVHVVVGTPGRVFDMINRRFLCTDTIKLLVLDAADEIIERGFKDQIYGVFRVMPTKCQVGLLVGPNRPTQGLFSAAAASMPEEVLEITDKFMRDPVHIWVEREELIATGRRVI